jgi:hypothetical protein
MSYNLGGGVVIRCDSLGSAYIPDHLSIGTNGGRTVLNDSECNRISRYASWSVVNPVDDCEGILDWAFIEVSRSTPLASGYARGKFAPWWLENEIQGIRATDYDFHNSFAIVLAVKHP